MSNFGHLVSRFQSGRSRFQAGWSRFQVGLSRFQAGRFRFRAGKKIAWRYSRQLPGPPTKVKALPREAIFERKKKRYKLNRHSEHWAISAFGTAL